MIKTILIASAVALTSAPVLADTVQSPKTTKPAVSFGLMSSNDIAAAPTMALYSTTVTNNISCRNKARSKYFELGARDMSGAESNSQWGTVGNMKAIVWCRDTQAIIAVSGFNYNSVVELRDEIVKAF